MRCYTDCLLPLGCRSIYFVLVCFVYIGSQANSRLNGTIYVLHSSLFCLFTKSYQYLQVTFVPRIPDIIHLPEI